MQLFYTKDKQINIEILRIISMIMVTTLHYLSHSGLLYSDFSISYIISWFFETISLIATNVFVVISSFFLYGKQLQLSRISKLHIKIIIFSILGVVFCLLFNWEQLSIGLLTYLIPVLSRKWGFVTNYVVFSITYPIIDIAVKNSTKKEHKLFIIIGLIIISIGSFLSSLIGCDYLRLHNGDSFVWFLYIYIVVSFIKKYDYTISKKTALLMWILPLLFQYISRLVISWISLNYYGEIKYAGIFYYGDLSVFSIISALGLFSVFRDIQIELFNPIIKKILLIISSASFGVYLIQEHPLLRDRIWSIVFANENYSIWELIITWIIVVISLFLVAVIVDRFAIIITDIFVRRNLKQQ